MERLSKENLKYLFIFMTNAAKEVVMISKELVKVMLFWVTLCNDRLKQ